MQNTELSGTEADSLTPDLEKKTGPLTREEVLKLSSETIRSLHKRISVIRFKGQAGDRDRLAYVRALVSLLQVYSGILKDQEIEDLEKRLDALEKEV